MPFSLTITDEANFIAQVSYNDLTWDIPLAKGFWSINDYKAHWGFASYELADYWRTKFLILEARSTGSPDSCRAFRVSRIANRFHFHDVYIKAPSQIGGYKGESLIQWLNMPRTPYLDLYKLQFTPSEGHPLNEFIVEYDDFIEWHMAMDTNMPEVRRPVEELTTVGDWA